MFNEVIIGNGESRKIKFGTFATTPTNVNDLITQLQSGTIGVDVVYPSATESAGISQAGTKLNQETLLNTAAESAIWGSAEPTLERTPSDAFKKIGDSITNIYATTSDLTAELDRAQSSIGTLNNRINTTEHSLANMANRLISAESSISNLEDFIPQIDRKLDKAGGTTTGTIIMGDANPSNSLSYPLCFGEDEIAYIKRTATGQLYIHNDDAIDFNNQRLIRVGSPVQSTDAVNKGYVNDHLPLYVNFTYVATNNTITSCDTDYAIISQAITNNRPVIACLINNQQTNMVHQTSLMQRTGNDTSISFKFISGSELYTVTITSGDTYSMSSKTFQFVTT